MHWKLPGMRTKCTYKAQKQTKEDEIIRLTSHRKQNDQEPKSEDDNF